MLHNALFDRRARRLGLGAGGVCGRAAVAFGTPINLEEFLQVGDRSGPAAGEALGLLHGVLALPYGRHGPG